jgi:Tol biopolymer transport system component
MMVCRKQRKRRAALVAGLACFAFTVSSSTAFATFPGATGRLAFTEIPADPAGTRIFTINPDGSGIKNLRVQGFEPSWSADGKNLVFVRGQSVFTMTADGGNVTRVTHDNGYVSSPHFSPNAGRIVYAEDNLPVADSDTPRRLSIFSVRSDGTDRRRLMTTTRNNYPSPSPVYAPNGRRIVFDAGLNGHRGAGIWTIRRDGSHLRRLARGVLLARDWSPDGQWILFQRLTDLGDTCGDGRAMRPDGSDKHPVPSGCGEVLSPSGESLAFWSGPSVSVDRTCSDVYTVPLVGGDAQTVTHNCANFERYGINGDAVAPSWQPLPNG